jgi:hypothetical protein
MANRSVFKVNAKNQLGIEFQKTRARLMELAYTSPASYYRLRKDVVEAITETAVEKAYESYWNLLTSGSFTDATGNPARLQWTDATGGDFQPNLPESEVNKFALRVASAIQEISEEAVETILPMDYDEIAKKKSKELLEAKNIKV